MIRLGDCLVSVKSADGEWRDTPLADGPFYLALEGYNEGLFNSQRELLLDETGDNEMSWQDFLYLRNAIRWHGFDCSKSPMYFSARSVLMDGQHRTSILLDIHGPDIRLETNEKREVVALWAKLSV